MRTEVKMSSTVPMFLSSGRGVEPSTEAMARD
jgi:hypothetical protein